MKRLVTLLLSVVITVGVLAPTIIAQQQVIQVITPAQVVQNTVFNLFVDDKAICTVFAVEGNKAISAGHCVRDITEGSVIKAVDVLGKRYFRLKLEHYQYNWPKDDFAVFSFADYSPAYVLRLSTTKPRVGETVYSMIGPLGYTPMFVTGIYSGRAGCAFDECRITGMDSVQMPGTYGASGSPVLDVQGRVWGILVGGNPSIPGIILVTPVPRV
jgi:hypothetical protein